VGTGQEGGGEIDDEGRGTGSIGGEMEDSKGRSKVTFLDFPDVFAAGESTGGCLEIFLGERGGLKGGVIGARLSMESGLE
jgi:hypothetical protein